MNDDTQKAVLAGVIIALLVLSLHGGKQPPKASGAVLVVVDGSRCSLAGEELPCETIPSRIAPGSHVTVDGTRGSHGVVEALLEALESAGFAPTLME